MRKLTQEELLNLRPTKEDIQQRKKRPIFGLIDNVRSLHNVGSIFRTADGAGVSKLYLCGITGSPPREEIRKTSLGAEESVEWQYHKSALDMVSQLKSEGVQIIVLEHTDSSVHFKQAKYKYPACLVVGHEHRGISDGIVEKADLAIEIPMYGIKQSLNVSVAFGLAIYELAHQFV
jgi:tRNA G18 (ribose-2'-O)-methylase SpoU